MHLLLVVIEESCQHTRSAARHVQFPSCASLTVFRDWC
jgi:hypothetical protein